MVRERYTGAMIHGVRAAALALTLATDGAWAEVTLFDNLGWEAAVAGVFVGLGLAAFLGLGLRERGSQ